MSLHKTFFDTLADFGATIGNVIGLEGVGPLPLEKDQTILDKALLGGKEALTSIGGVRTIVIVIALVAIAVIAFIFFR